MEKSQNKKKSKAINVILYIILALGLGIWLYPTAADYWNRRKTVHTTAVYQKTVETENEETLKQIWNDARAYNNQLYYGMLTLDSEKQKTCYNNQLNMNGDGMMGTIEIPAIKVSLPIFHTSTEEVLQTAVGHVEQSSLPVGGENTHCVLSAHRGNTSAKLFTNLDMLQKGDIFILNILDQTMTYEIDNIIVVEPEDVKWLQISPGQELCTLVTCTPYGINTHRLLVRGHRVESTQEKKGLRVAADAIQIEPIITAPIAAMPWLFMLMILLAVTRRRRKTKEVKI